MNVKKEITMVWEEAPDTITPEMYAQIRGIGTQTARNIFNSKGFPRIEGAGAKPIAEKIAVQLYDMGLNPKQNQKQSIEYLILLELKKLNKKGSNTND